MKFYGRRLKNTTNLLFELVIFIFVVYIAVTPLYFDQLTTISVFLLFFIMFVDLFMLQASIHRMILILQKKPLLEVTKESIYQFSFFFPMRINKADIERITEDAAAKKRFIYVKLKSKPKKSFFDPVIRPFTQQKMIDTTFVYGEYKEIYQYITQKK